MKKSLLNGLIASKGLFKIFSIGLMGFFFLYLFISAGMTAYEQKDVSTFFKEIGNEMIKPLSTAQDYAQNIVSDKDNIGKTLWSYWGFYYSLYKLYLWMWVLMIPVNLLFKENNPPIIRYGISIFLFLIIMILFSVIQLKESPNYPFIVFKDIFNAFKSLMIKF